MQEQVQNENAHDFEELSLRAEQIGQLYRNAPVGLIASPINAVALFFVLRNVVPSQTLIAWLAAVFLVTILRLLLLNRYQRAPSASIDAGTWGAWFTAGAFLSGLAWGSAGIFLFPAASIAHQTFIAFVLGGMAAGAAATYAVLLPAFLAYAVPALLPIIIRFLTVGGEIHTAMAVMLLLFTTLIIFVGKRVNAVSRLSLRLRFKNINIISDLSSSITNVEKLNAELAAHRENLEKLVAERTTELEQTNTKLTREVDERRRAEESVRRSAERFQSLIEHGHDMITVLDSSGKVLYNSPSLERILGYSDADLLGKSIFEFIHPDDQAGARAALAHVVEEPGKTENMEVRLKHKNGGWRLLDAAGKSSIDELWAVHAIVNSRDVTERRQMEDSLHRMQKLESLGVFAGGLAHDLNNVLTGVMANIDLALLSGQLEEQASRRLEQAMKAADRARDLTNQLVTFSKGGEPAKRVISIGNLVKTSAELAVSGTSVNCEVIVPELLWPVEADEGQIAQVIKNILVNAVEAMPQGGKVRIECDNVPADPEGLSDSQEKRHVKITIKDQGNGIPAEHLDKIFDPYFTSKQGGRGLGLAVAYSVVNRHEGRITVESEPGAGAAFHVYLPATDKPVEASDAGEQKIFKKAGNILLMDDEAIVRDVAGAALRTLGYVVTVASDGAEALELYRQAANSSTPYDAVILDLTVPGGIGGKDAIKKLLAMDPQARVIVSSGYSDDPIMAHFEGYGFAAAVAKPYKIQDIGEVLKKVLSS